MDEHKPVDDAVVIGGGLAGLAAAIRLKEHGVKQVTLIEREERFGGLAISLRYDGLSTDLGPHRLYTELPEIEAFYREIAGPSVISVRRRSSMFLQGKFLHYPLRVRDLLAGPGPLNLMRFGASWAAAHLHERLKHPPKGDFEALMASAFGRALYDYLIGPYTAKVWKTDPRRLDADAARVRVSAGSLMKMVRGMFINEQKGRQTALRQFHYVKGGAQTLVNHLVEHAHVAGARLLARHELAGFQLGPDGAILAVEARARDGQIRTFPAQRVVSSIPMPALARCVHEALPLRADVLREADSMRYLNLVFVFVVIKRGEVRGDQWTYFPESQYVFNRASEAKAFDPSMGREGRSILAVETTCLPGEGFWVEPDEAVIEQVMPQLYRTGIFSAQDVLSTHVYRLPFAYPVYDVGYRAKLDAVLKELARVGNLVTTGRQGLFSFNNMDHSMYMGIKAADCCATSDRPAARWLSEKEDFKNLRIVD